MSGANGHLLAAAVNLNHPDHYFHWGFVLISVANPVVISVMLALFAAAITLPFLRARPLPVDDTDTLAADTGHAAHSPGPEPATWTGALRRVGLRYLLPAKLLPEAQPAYAASYVFGVATLAALGAVIATGGTGDVLVVAIISVLTLSLLLVPFIPGLRDIPRWVPLYRLIWRRYYREHLHGRHIEGLRGQQQREVTGPDLSDAATAVGPGRRQPS